MKNLSWLGILGAFVATAWMGALHAQVVDDAVAVPVHFQGRFDAENSNDYSNPASVTITALAANGTPRTAEGTSMTKGTYFTSGGFARLRPGRAYLFKIDTHLSTRLQVKITPPSGHRVFINGVEHEMFDWQMGDGGLLDPQGFFSVRLEDGSGAAVGDATSLRPGRLLWSLGLGNLRNSKPAGSLRIAEDGITANAFTPGALYYDHDSGADNGSYVSDDGEVIITKVDHVLRQVYAATVLADIKVQNGSSYSIRLFSRTDVPNTPDAQGVFDMGDKTPLVEFLIENPTYPSLDGIRITKTTHLNGQLVMWTQMTRQSGQPSGTNQWLVEDWVEKPSGGTAPSSPVKHRWTYSDNDRNEHLRIEDSSGNVAQSVFKRYEDYSFDFETSRELFYEISGCNPSTATTPANAETLNSIKTTYAYYLNPAPESAGNWHKVATIDTNDGAHTAFAYCNEFENRGQIFQIRRPQKNTNPVNAGPDANGEITTFAYDFLDYFGTKRLPTSILTTVNGTPTSRTEFSYSYESITDASATYDSQHPEDAVMPLTVITRKDYSDDANFLTTITRVYREDADPQYKFFPGLPYSIERPDKTMSAMVYFHAQFQPGDPFYPSIGAGARVHVTLKGTSNSALGSSMTFYNSTAQPLPANFTAVPDKSSQSRVLFDPDGLPKIMEEQIYSSSLSWSVVRQDWSIYISAIWPSYTQRRTATSGPFWDIARKTWSGGRLTESGNESGITQKLSYDSVGRIIKITRDSVSANGASLPAQSVEMSYDAVGRLLQRWTTSGGEMIASSTTYDTAGRVNSESSPGQGTTSYTYDVSNRSVMATLPTGATRIETRYLDGRLASVTGNVQVPEYYDYGVEADGRRRSTVSALTSGGPRTALSRLDRLGRPIERIRPGFNNVESFSESTSYDPATGLPTLVSRTGYAPTRLEYDGMGGLKRRGLLVNGGFSLLEASADRVTDLETKFESYNGAYWLTSRTWVYATAGSSTRTLVETTRERVTGLSPTLRAETRITDVDGNETVRTVNVDSASQLVTINTTRAGVTNAATEIRLADFLVSSTGHDGVTRGRSYDGLGRLSTTTDPRAGTSTIHYKPGTRLVEWLKDPAQNQVTSYTYDTAGRVIAVSDAAGRLTRTAYNTRNQVIRQWGQAAYPVEFAYNALGERIAMRTFRSGDFTGSSWPLMDSGLDLNTGSPDPSSWLNGDKTTWTYDSYSGLLSAKTDAAGASVTYTYNKRGQTASRTWARGTVTTYGYDDKTGELLTQTYSDGTPSVAYTYTRAAQINTAADATGQRTFNYGNGSPLQLDSISLPGFFNGRTLRRNYDTIHRPVGFTLDGEVTQTWAFQAATGRLSAVTTGSSAQTARTYTWGYNSGGLVSSLTDGGSFSVNYDYEANRDLLKLIDSTWNSESRTRYDYTYNSLGQRQTARQSGHATNGAFADFGNATTYNYTYNERGELTSAADYLGLDATNPSSQLPGRNFAYDFDPAGNRKTASRTGTAGAADAFSVNSLNQYASRENNVAHTAGTAQAGSSISVTGGSTVSGIGRQGRYWDAQVTLHNTNGPALESLSIAATLVGQGTGGVDLVRQENRMAFLAKALQSFTYDADGNLISDGVWKYFYDGENRLVAIETDPTVIPLLGTANARRLEFRYDYLNRRVEKLVRTGWNGSTYATVASQRRYLYDGDNIAVELSGDGSVLLRSYTWALDLAGSLTATGGVGALVQITDHTNGASYCPTYDGNGNVASLLNTATGSIAAAYEYSPSGELLRCAGSYATSNPFRFSTKFTDDETGLVYYGARFFSPSLGRFINRDPIEEAGGLNLYGFCGNDGVNGTDYLGMDPIVLPTLYVTATAIPPLAPLIAVTAIATGIGKAVGGFFKKLFGGGGGASSKPATVPQPSFVRGQINPNPNAPWEWEPVYDLEFPDEIRGWSRLEYFSSEQVRMAPFNVTASRLLPFASILGTTFNAAFPAASLINGTVGQYRANLKLGDGHFNAINMTFNPAYMAMSGFNEMWDGIGMDEHDIGERLTRWGRTRAALKGVVGTVGTVGAATGMTAAGSSAFRSAALSRFPTQERASGAVHNLVSPTRLVVTEHHFGDIVKVFEIYDGELNAFRQKFWKHVFPHRHVYDLENVPPKLTSNWRKTFENLDANKTTIWPWDALP